MAPSPENDNAPKAPDKSDTTKCEQQCSTDNNKEHDRDEKTLSNLNDGELKALLDEAMNYKNPKDREGKSKLFKDLLTQAEETERIARATSAGGSEVARHYNTSARHHRRLGVATGVSAAGGGDLRHPHSRHQRRRQPASISENVVHGGSLDNLAKEELFRESALCLVEAKSVSARQREGGSLPCDVNSSANVVPTPDYQFLEEARKNKAQKSKEYTAIDIESSMETQRLLDHDSLAQKIPENQEITILPRYTTNATLQISATPVDDPIPLELDSGAEKKHYDVDNLQTKVLHSKYSVYIPTYRSTEERRVDENGNHQNQAAKAKKKKIQTDKNVTVLTAERVEGHRSDIINDVDKLIQYIRGDKGGSPTGGGKGGKSNVHKSKQLHKQHASEEGPSNRKKQRANSSKGKESRSELKKSNSLGEISTAALDDFAFVETSGAEKEGDTKVVMRHKTPGDRPKERRSWGNAEPAPFPQAPSSSASTENLETSDNWVVTKPKKKSKRRRNSASGGGGRRPPGGGGGRTDRTASPDARGKSMPPSEKSNDSSDNDSVRSLPLDGPPHRAPASYADMAKVKERRPTPEKSPVAAKSPEKAETPPDVRNVRTFPAIPEAERAEGGGGSGSGGASRSGGAGEGEFGLVEAAAAVVVVDSSIQNDLTIIHSNEKESIQFNAQMLPPNIPDVQTIEKMHFLNHPPPPLPPPEPAPKAEAPPLPPPSPPTVPATSSPIAQCAGSDQPPPVVILSGMGSKEMTSELVFGFDVNQQLLNEDICEDFIARYVPPESFDGAAINHDKIVNFIGSAWDAIVNESNGEVKYYSENS